MSPVRMYCTHMCGYCRMALQLLAGKGVAVESIYVDDQPERRTEMQRLTGRRTVPQIFIGRTHVGGYSDLAALERAQQLDALLQAGG
jgi:glutaredoxin 3